MCNTQGFGFSIWLRWLWWRSGVGRYSQVNMQTFICFVCFSCHESSSQHEHELSSSESSLSAARHTLLPTVQHVQPRQVNVYTPVCLCVCLCTCLSPVAFVEEQLWTVNKLVIKTSESGCVLKNLLQKHYVTLTEIYVFEKRNLKMYVNMLHKTVIFGKPGHSLGRKCPLVFPSDVLRLLCLSAAFYSAELSPTTSCCCSCSFSLQAVYVLLSGTSVNHRVEGEQS